MTVDAKLDLMIAMQVIIILRILAVAIEAERP